MRNIRAIIVDDEVLGRSRIRKLLSGYDHVSLVGEGKNGQEAVKLIEDYRPDLAFMDVEMPDKDGFQVLKTLDESAWPFVIFVTAHDRFALKAFDVKAVDYLLKPFDDVRFERALNSATEQIKMKDESLLNAQLIRIMDDYRMKVQGNPYIISIKDRGREHKINIYDIVYIEADGNYLKLQLEKERHLLRATMQQMQEELDQNCFLRIHRSVIVNVNYLKVKTYKGNNEYVFKLRNGMDFISGRSFKEDIDEFFALTGAS